MIASEHRLLDPVARVSEVLFGLIMAVTIVGTISIATSGQGEVRTLLWAALGCNVAWGLVDAVMHFVANVTERMRERDPAAAETERVANWRDVLEALGIFLLCVVSTFPVVIPFLATNDVEAALRWSRWITLAMLFAAGYILGRYARHPKPLWAGALAAAFGGALILAVMALGG